MGVHVSKDSALAPITLASTLIGFTSFAFTLGTFFRVFWTNIMTVMDAAREIPDMLGNVKQELLEEKTHIRIVRRRHRRQESSDLHLRVLNDAVRNMFQDFKSVERRFLVDPHEYWEPYNSKDQYYDDEKGWGRYDGRRGGRWVKDRGWTDDDDYLNTEYKSVNLWDRLVWVRKRGHVIALAEKLGRVQTRRITRQTTAIAGDTRFLCQAIQDVEDRLYNIEQRLSNMKR